MRPLERGLRRLAASPFTQAYEIGIGALVVPAYQRAGGPLPAGWRLFAFFLLVLLLVRFIPAVIRLLVPFPRGLRAYWLANRVLAKRYDSYQWRKLLWFGAGVAGYLIAAGHAGGADTALAVSCLTAGAVGELAWRRRQTPPAAAPSPQRVAVGQLPQR